MKINASPRVERLEETQRRGKIIESKFDSGSTYFIDVISLFYKNVENLGGQKKTKTKQKTHKKQKKLHCFRFFFCTKTKKNFEFIK